MQMSHVEIISLFGLPTLVLRCS